MKIGVTSSALHNSDMCILYHLCGKQRKYRPKKLHESMMFDHVPLYEIESGLGESEEKLLYQ